MCGIVGRAGRPGPDAPLPLDSIRHRGPDDRGEMRVGHARLGHTRLSIIDIGGGAQPMTSADGRLTIVFNGEIYNYRELRPALAARGYPFKTASDTEVILAVYQEWGIEGFARLRGMFAFALADRHTRETVLVRDPFGIKPLFVHRGHGEVLFASEKSAIIEMLGRTPEIDHTSVLETLLHRYPIAENSLYSGIKRLAPGTALIIGDDGKVCSRPFTSLIEAIERARAEGEDADPARVRVKIADSVAHHAIADVQVGCFLSGGLDSSVVALKLAKASQAQVRAYTVSFASTRSERSELPYARAVAEHIGADLVEVTVSGDDFAELAPRLSGSANGPFPDPADVAILKMSLAAASDVKVVLSGEGADEAFAGYPKYAFDRYAGIVPGGLARVLPAGRLGRAGIALGALSERERSVRWLRWFQNASPPGLMQSLIAAGADSERAGGWVSDRIAAYPAGWSNLQRMQMLDVESWLPNNLLHRGDYTTMQASLEQRVPFLDQATTPWAIALPDSAKIGGWSGKRALRGSFAGRLPRVATRRPKSGFRLPLGDWLLAQGQLRSLAHDLLLAPNAGLRAWVEGDRLRDILDPKRLATSSGAKLAWTALSLELWLGSLTQPASAGSLRR